MLLQLVNVKQNYFPLTRPIAQCTFICTKNRIVITAIRSRCHSGLEIRYQTLVYFMSHNSEWRLIDTDCCCRQKTNLVHGSQQSLSVARCVMSGARLLTALFQFWSLVDIYVARNCYVCCVVLLQPPCCKQRVWSVSWRFSRLQIAWCVRLLLSAFVSFTLFVRTTAALIYRHCA